VTVDARLAGHRDAWIRKPSLRAVYGDFHKRLLNACPRGRLLEIGSGSGHLRDLAPDVVSIDILPSPWVDFVADAHRLPFADSSFSGMVMIDVLHHLERPTAFFAEATRVLRPGGRLAMIEPAITPLSWLFYNFVHEEPVDLSADPFASAEPDPGRDPFDANQAIPTLLFCRASGRERFAKLFPGLVLSSREWFSLFAYPLTGGFKPWSLIPAGAVAPMLRLEQALSPILGGLMAFRLFVVLERIDSPSPD
jgi:SAM-dependent methyltransferase